MNSFTIVFAFAMVAMASAGAVSYAKRTDGHGHPEETVGYGEHKDYHTHPEYKFEYGVKDPHTKDHKSAWEHRDGDKVVGEYSLDEADGTKRVVSYTADDKHGFQAVVKNIGHAEHPAVYGKHQEYQQY